MDRIKADFVSATERGIAAGFDWLEFHCAHGYLMSSFISPLTNQRKDEYGGSLENRCRYPLEVFKAMRAVWPQDKPMSVRISAHDWVPGGITPEDAAIVARLFKCAGADMIDCSSGQVSKDERPVYGRMFQVPFSDRIRNEVGIPTIAVGNIFEGDHVNTIIAAGRADLCAVARPHLADPAWTLHEAAKQGYTDMWWPDPVLERQRTTRKKSRSRGALEATGVTDASRGLGSQLLSGKHALVTGGSRGIGAAVVEMLARARRARHEREPHGRAAERICRFGIARFTSACELPTLPIRNPWRKRLSRRAVVLAKSQFW